MNKSTSRSKAADPSSADDQQKNARPEDHTRVPPTSDNQPEPQNGSSGNSTIHNGSANAFDATEEPRDDEDSDEDNDDFARDYK